MNMSRTSVQMGPGVLRGITPHSKIRPTTLMSETAASPTLAIEVVAENAVSVHQERVFA
jgi:hypothetical protein